MYEDAQMVDRMAGAIGSDKIRAAHIEIAPNKVGEMLKAISTLQASREELENLMADIQGVDRPQTKSTHDIHACLAGIVAVGPDVIRDEATQISALVNGLRSILL